MDEKKFKRHSGKFADITAFLAERRKLYIFVDFDGTISKIVKTPAKAVPLEGAVAALKRLKKKSNIKIAVVSGREISFLRKFFPRGFTLVGCHGAEIVDGGIAFSRSLSAVQKKVKDLTAAFFRAAVFEGIFMEEKKYSLALHYRNMSLKNSAVLLAAVKEMEPALGEFSLEILSGRKVVEIRAKGVGKGKAVRKLAAAAKHYESVYFGDDETDEDVFRLAGVTGIKIGAGKTAARFRLDSPADAVKVIGGLV
ncbi:MAG: trehalose-phosphatase [Elusimicrobiota bacterium]|nr:trehalose-phosphatase [Elusimicrobiota bacterium]